MEYGITGTYDGKGIYRIENMSVRIISNDSNSEPYYNLLFELLYHHT